MQKYSQVNMLMTEILSHPYVKSLHGQIDDMLNKREHDSTPKISLPYVKKDAVLMAPGKWNYRNYSDKAISKIFKNTDWDSRAVRSIFMEHKDQSVKNGVDTWLGFVVNPRLEQGGVVKGDLFIYDEPTAVKMEAVQSLSKGTPPNKNIFGISPRVLAEVPSGTDNVVDGRFDNFSLVVNPAVKRAFINNSQEKEGSPMSEEKNQENMLSATELLNEIKSLKAELSSMKENIAKKQTPAEEKSPEQMKKKEAYPEPDQSQMAKKQKYPEEQMSDAELTEIISNASFSDFVKKYRKDHPGASFKEIAKVFKTHKMTDISVLQTQIEEMSKQIETLNSRLDKAPEIEVENITMSDVEKMEKDPSLNIDTMMLSALKPRGVVMVGEVPL